METELFERDNFDPQTDPDDREASLEISTGKNVIAQRQNMLRTIQDATTIETIRDAFWAHFEDALEHDRDPFDPSGPLPVLTLRACIKEDTQYHYG